jgi:integrase
MAGVHFYLKPTKKEKQHIFLSFIYQKRGKPFKFYTNLYSPQAYWDSDSERIVPPKNARYDQATEINIMLDKLQNGVVRLTLRCADERITLTDELLKRELVGLRNLQAPKKGQLTFLQFFEQFVEKKTSVPNYVKNSAKAYITTLKHVKGYVESGASKFDFGDINRDVLEGFVTYLKSKNFQPNHIQKIASTLKTVLKIADEDDVSPSFRLKSSWLSAPRVETDATYLKPKELEVLENFDLSTNRRLERVRDLFLIGCYTGLRYSDYSILNPDCFTKADDGTIKLSLRAKKTGSPINYPLYPNAEKILRKYEFNSPVQISNTKMNKYLKELGELAGINESFKYSKMVNGVRKDFTCFKWEKISTHTARRTFATNAMANDMPTELIMHMTGHKNLVDFFKYIRFSHEDKNLRIQNHSSFLNELKEVKSKESPVKDDAEKVKVLAKKWLL